MTVRAVAATIALAAAALSVSAAANHHNEMSKSAAKGMSLDAALAAPHRSPENRARDQYRHPKQTLAFFGLKPNMTVVEISPSRGWYTEILAPVLRERGKYYGAWNNPAASEAVAKALGEMRTRFAATPAVYDRVNIVSFAKDHYDKLAPAGSADMVLTFRNVHNWHQAGFAPQAFQAFYTTLKPGGVLGVVEHRLPESRPAADQMTSGYMKQSEVIRLAQAAGFKLAARSEINANPKDTANHPEGVWTLPPNYRLGDKDRAKYAAIGESDRMTLKFVKPKG